MFTERLRETRASVQREVGFRRRFCTSHLVYAPAVEVGGGVVAEGVLAHEGTQAAEMLGACGNKEEELIVTRK